MRRIFLFGALAMDVKVILIDAALYILYEESLMNYTGRCENDSNVQGYGALRIGTQISAWVTKPDFLSNDESNLPCAKFETQLVRRPGHLGLARMVVQWGGSRVCRPVDGRVVAQRHISRG